MILDIDVGNTYVKWRLSTELEVIKRGSQKTDSLLCGQQLNLGCVEKISRARLCSVGNNEVNSSLGKQILSQFNVVLEVAFVSKTASGVHCGYEEYLTLGVDRWMGMVAAYTKFKRALLIIDAGSATTLDLIDEDGNHLGGYILPGITLMRNALSVGTQKVKVGAPKITSIDPALRTEDAVNNGSLLSLVATIEKTAGMHPSQIILTGGVAEAIMDCINLKAEYIPELVLDGLSAENVTLIPYNK